MSELTEHQVVENEPQIKPPSMNNFYSYLPGGRFRELNNDQNPEKQRLMQTIDELLKDEFPEINGLEIHNHIFKISGLILKTFSNNVPPEERKKLFSELREVSEKLRPLFNRLLEMGFDINEITR
jgi:predicted AAA+ superfamily ATPase